MKFKKRSLRTRIFLSMILLVVGASILIAAITVYQYKEESLDYHGERLERKEEAVRRSISYQLDATSFVVNAENLPHIFREKIFEIQNIHNQVVALYDLEGKLLTSSRPVFQEISESRIPEHVLKALEMSADKRYYERFEEDGQRYRSSYSYITDNYFKPIGILHLPYVEEDEFLGRELNEFLLRLAQAYLLLIGAAIALAYLLSRYITRSLQAISEKIKATSFDKRIQKIDIDSPGDEIATVVDAYNSMTDRLEESAAALAATERESAWREMARQVAHEIKNPLTPMRLTVQNFERKFDPGGAPDAEEKLKEFSHSLIQQIDTMNAIASAFSTYAQMPAQKDETLNMVKVTKLALDIFNELYIRFQPEAEEITIKMDRTQLIRVVTNLVKNAIQSVEQTKNPEIAVRVSSEKNRALITVSDNGIGIPEENRSQIFEPRFTTKTSGMGLGLAMVKNIVESYSGHINFKSRDGQGTVFYLDFPSV